MRKMLFGALLVWGLFNIAQGQNLESGATDATVPGDRGGGSVLFSTIGGIDPVSAFVITSQHFTDPVFNDFATHGADDFTVTGNGWEITTVEVRGAYFNQPGNPQVADSVNVYIVGNSGNLPDTTNLSAGSIYALENASYTDIGSGDFQIPLVPDGSPGITLQAGTYWLVVQANLSVMAGGQWGWTEAASAPNSGTPNGFESAWFQTTAGFIPPGTCIDAWGRRITDCGVTRNPDTSPPADPDFAFLLEGNQYVPGIVVDPTAITTSEPDITNCFTVVLEAPPLSGQMVSIDIDDSGGAGEGTADVSTLVFTKANWNIPQKVTITPVDDGVAESPVMWTLVLDPAVSGDGGYSGLDPSDVTVTNLDNESAGITVSPIAGIMINEGSSMQFNVSANTAPTDDVTVPLMIVTASSATVPVNVVLPSGSTADVPVTISTTDDDIDDDNLPFTVQTGDPTSAGDAVYDALGAGDVADVTGTVLDDDTAGIMVTAVPNPLATSENDGGFGGNTVTMVLQSEPTGNVTIDVTTSDSSEAVASATSVVFTPANWDTPQNVDVLGVDDDIDDGTVAFTFVTSPATSTDPKYNNLDPANITGSNADNGDMAGFIFTPTSVTTTEAGGTDSFDVRLSSEPVFNVTLSLNTSDTSEGLISASPAVIGTVPDIMLTFTPANWDSDQTVVVTGQDDDVADGDINYTILTTGSTSLDPNYSLSGGQIADVSAVNEDDDVIGVDVDPTVLSTDEDGPSVLFDVVLISEPSANVTIPIGPPDPTEATVSTTSLTFTPGNWDTPQTVTVSPLLDGIVDADQVFTLVNGPANGGNYVNVPVDDVQVTIINIDECEPVEVTAIIGDDIIIYDGAADCVVDLYNTFCSDNPADWQYLGTFTLGPNGSIDTGVTAVPDACYLVTITQTTFPLSERILTVPTLGEWGMIAFLSLLAIAGLFFVRKRRFA
jgi:hypothetical protein